MTIRTDLLRKLSTHLRTGSLMHKNFDYSVFNVDICAVNSGKTLAKEGTCGTNGCALGECPAVFPDSWEFSYTGLPSLKAGCAATATDVFTDAQHFFELDDIKMALHLFSPGEQQPEVWGGQLCRKSATRAEVADLIDAFCDLVDAGKIV